MKAQTVVQDIPPPPPPPPPQEKIEADTAQPRVTDFIREIEKVDDHNQRMALVMWFPWQYWQASMVSNGIQLEGAVLDMINELKNYTVICVIDGKPTPYGMVYYPDDEIRENIQLTINDSIKLSPVPEKELGETMHQLVAILKPTMRNMLGNMGDNTNFFIFKNTYSHGKKYIDAAMPGKFSVSWKGDLSIEFRLPLDVLTPPKYCPVDGEKESGKFIYCPYHGVKLNTSPK